MTVGRRRGPRAHAPRAPDQPRGAARAGGGLRAGARLYAGRGAAGPGAEDLLPARARGVERADRLLPGGHHERALSLAARPPARPVRRGLRGGRRRVQRGHAHDRADLGQADLGHLVDLGRPAHADAVPLLPLHRLPGAPRLGARSGRAGAVQRGGGDPRDAARAVHPSERVPVPDAPSAADRAQAERAVAAAGDAPDAAGVDGGVHPALRRPGDRCATGWAWPRTRADEATDAG